MTTGRPERRRPGGIGYALAAGLAAVLLYYSLRDVEWNAVAALLARASPAPLLLCVVIMSAALLLRAWRWRVLLAADGEVSMSIAFWATAAGYLANNLLPARAGELIRSAFISTRTKLSGAFVLATALSERIADTVALMLVTSIVLLVLPAPPGWLPASAARTVAMLGLSGAAALALLPRLESLTRRAIKALPVSSRLRERLDAAAAAALRGIRAFHDGPRLAKFVALTLIIWHLDALGSVVVAATLGLDLPLSVAFLLIAGLSVGTALPSTPGYIGIYQFVAVMVLVPFGFSNEDAIAFILLVQVMSYLVIGGYGAIGLLKSRRAA